MNEITDSLRSAVKAIDKLKPQFRTPQTTKLKRLTSELITEIESDSPDVARIEALTEQVNQLKG